MIIWLCWIQRNCQRDCGLDAHISGNFNSNQSPELSFSSISGSNPTFGFRFHTSDTAALGSYTSLIEIKDDSLQLFLLELSQDSQMDSLIRDNAKEALGI